MENTKEQSIAKLIFSELDNANFIALVKVHDDTDFGTRFNSAKFKDIVRLLVNQVINGTIKSAYYPHANFSFVEGADFYTFAYSSPLGHTEILKISKVLSSSSAPVQHIVNHTANGDIAMQNYNKLGNENYIFDEVIKSNVISNRDPEESMDILADKLLESGKYIFSIYDKVNNIFIKNYTGHYWTRPGFLITKLNDLAKERGSRLANYEVHAIPLEHTDKINALLFVSTYNLKQEIKNKRTEELRKEKAAKLEIQKQIESITAMEKSLAEQKLKLEAFLNNKGK
jgi:hypothetical protein